MLTRKGRNVLKQSVIGNLNGLTEELMHNEVIDFAVNIHSLLGVLTHKYSSDDFLELVPEIITVLNRLDACLRVVDDLTENLNEACHENKTLKRTLEVEKENNKFNFEASLSLEKDAEKKIELLKQQVAQYEHDTKELRDELGTKSKIIEILTNDCAGPSGNLDDVASKYPTSTRNKNKEDSFYQLPKKVTKQRVCPSEEQHHKLITPNRFSPLSDESINEPGTEIQVTALVHQEDTDSLSTHRQAAPSIPSTNYGTKSRILMLSDSHGKSMYQYMNKLSPHLTIVSKSNAKLKHVTREGKTWADNHTLNDYVFVLAGTNDLDREGIRMC